MSITFDIKPEILKKYSEEQLKDLFNIFLMKIDKMNLEDDFIPTDEFLDFREVNLNELPKEFKTQLLETNSAFDR
ncbi:MAG: hypothetical protein LBQ24_06420 [Candidatus Peribacteria bacterium]|jgi:hypothetical protein|nr:hypothetical protein [Candidatus Peribacteria bacterium]